MKKLSNILAILILLLVCCASLARAELIRLMPSPVELSERRVEWFGVYLGEIKAGHMRAERGFSLDAEHPGHLFAEDVFLNYVSMGKRVRSRVRSEFLFDLQAPHRLISARLISDGKIRVEILAREDKWSVRANSGGEMKQAVVRPWNFVYADLLTPELWVRRGAQSGQVMDYRALSLEDAEMQVHRATIQSIVSETGEFDISLRDGRERVYAIRTGIQGHLLRAELGAGLSMRRMSKEQAQAGSGAVDLYNLFQCPVDRELGGAQWLDGLEMEAFGADARKLKAGPGQRLQTLEDGSVLLQLGTLYVEPSRASSVEIKQATTAERRYASGNDILKSLARRAVQGEQDARRQAELLVEFVQNYVIDDPTPQYTDVLTVLKHKRGDCTEHALLYTALGRSLGLAVREVYGLLYDSRQPPGFSGHAWVEVALDGCWQGMDPTLGQIVLDATHVRLGAGEEGLLALPVDDLMFRVRKVSWYEAPREELEQVLGAGKLPSGQRAQLLSMLAADDLTQGHDDLAIRRLEEAVALAPGMPSTEMLLARVLKSLGRDDQAFAHARSVLRHAEDSKLVDQAMLFLNDKGPGMPPVEAGESGLGDARIVFVPVGTPQRRLLREVAVRIESLLGVQVAVDGHRQPMDSPQRTQAQGYVFAAFREVASRLKPELSRRLVASMGKTGRPSTHQERLEFMKAYYAAAGREKRQERFDFLVETSKLRGQEQYRVMPLLKSLAARFSLGQDKPQRVVLGVTERDLFDPGVEYLLGYSNSGSAMVSYHRMTSRFEGREGQDRQRLLSRLVKQTLGSLSLALGAPPCNNAECVCSRSLSLRELDAKPETMCAECLTAVQRALH
ncbi:transglutaminase domain-containing protein [Desulfovibrio ferrophilus]|uniref:Transglutaminase-like superfamily domain protein n=1 Tax=Desulfovibrio ferrophilus TaxID=241368 RepID=A0A2Z6AXK5_9BACT|nr:transglutaminase domain-containing protein [Desulfovibrio ferrophilus]BBD07938.1 transglutaminase-like superfamily domain protein [Desulfovibrio ferrophilus]